MDEETGRRLADLDERLRVIEKMAGIGVPVPPPQTVERPATPPGEGRREAGPSQVPPRTSANLESLIGAHWLNRIGIAAVLVGVAYFLKYAFENEWVGPAARIGIGIAIGVALLAWSERFHSRGYGGEDVTARITSGSRNGWSPLMRKDYRWVARSISG
ncbi:MAG: DUF2339 domain-containing protein [Thermoanaerobaculia bacterium]